MSGYTLQKYDSFGEKWLTGEYSNYAHGVYVSAAQILKGRVSQAKRSDAYLAIDQIPAIVVKNGNLKEWLHHTGNGRFRVRVHWLSNDQSELVWAHKVEPLGAKRSRVCLTTAKTEAKETCAKQSQLAMPFKALVLEPNQFIQTDGKKIIFKVVGNELCVNSKGRMIIPADKGVPDGNVVGNVLGVDSNDVSVNPGDGGVDDGCLC